jgi:putative transposase
MPMSRNYRGFCVPHSVEIPCGAGFQPAWSPYRERLRKALMHDYNNDMKRTSYPADITDEQWLLIEPHIPGSKPGGRPRKVGMRQKINGLLYQSRTGCQWRSLPNEFPPWSTVAYYFYRFRDDGTWQLLHDSLRQQVRRAANKQPTPSAAIIDSQSVKTAEKKGGLLRL